MAIAVLVAAANAAWAQTAEDREAIVASCQSELQLSASGCECVADRAETGLDAATHHLLAVLLSDPDEIAAMAAGEGFTPEQVEAVSMFVVTAPSQCAQETM